MPAQKHCKLFYPFDGNLLGPKLVKLWFSGPGQFLGSSLMGILYPRKEERNASPRSITGVRLGQALPGYL